MGVLWRTSLSIIDDRAQVQESIIGENHRGSELVTASSRERRGNKKMSALQTGGVCDSLQRVPRLFTIKGKSSEPWFCFYSFALYVCFTFSNIIVHRTVGIRVSFLFYCAAVNVSELSTEHY